MDNKVDLKKKVYDNRQFSRVINREFETFVEPIVEDQLSIEEFFDNYERLFLSIDIEGEINSHEYLVRRSGALVRVEQETEDIQPLLDEIASLRTRLLEANQQIANLEIQVESQN